MRKNEVLVLAHYFLPVAKAGGPPKSIANLLDAIDHNCNFKILTCDHEFKSNHKFQNIELNRWTLFQGKKVFYQSNGIRALWRIFRESFSCDVNVIYLNSFFDPQYTILPLWSVGLFTKKRIVLAPRGEFSPSALAIKKIRKALYLWIFKKFKLEQRILWQAASAKEAEDLKQYFGGAEPKIELLPNFPTAKFIDPPADYQKNSGQLRMAYLARIARIKNTKFALEALKDVKGLVKFDIYGPIEDKAYWAECVEIINGLPKNIQVELKGHVPADEVLPTLNNYDLYFLPTLGENFGHTIFEALAASVPVLISTLTPWRNLMGLKAGADIDLSDPKGFIQTIQHFVDYDVHETLGFRHGANKLARSVLASSEDFRRAKDLFLL